MNMREFVQKANNLLNPILYATLNGVAKWDYNEWDDDGETFKTVSCYLKDDRHIEIFDDGQFIIMSSDDEEGVSHEIFNSLIPIRTAQKIFEVVIKKEIDMRLNPLLSFVGDFAAEFCEIVEKNRKEANA